MCENIENNIHLTPEEKLNLKNLGVSVKLYGAIGNGNADDTSAFTAALENNSRVYVPGGTYKITGELVIPENCELELAQDAILDFDPSYLKETTNNETGEKHVVVIPYEQFHCITLETAGSLVGNHATVNVPYNFKGSVLYVSADPEDSKADNGSVDSIKGFRYLKDINIIKIFESNDNIDLDGTAVSWNKETGGTGLLIERSNAYPAVSGLCGLDFSDLRITGAFDYGIRCINTDAEASWKKEWNYDTHIGAVIDGCRTGVYMYHYSNASISALIKLRCAYDPETVEADLKYAEHGIHLVNSINIDLSSSRIEDWGLRNGNPSISNEFKHINLVGDCRGLMIDSSLCSETDCANVRDCIHTNTFENYDNMTVLGEANTDYFNYDKDSVDNYLLHDFKIKYSGNTGALEKATDITSTCFIPCTKNSTIIVKDFVFINDGNANRIAFYNEFGESLNKLVSYGGFSNYFDYKRFGNEEDNEYRITFKPEKLPDFANIRMCCNTENIGSCPTVYYGIEDGGNYVKDFTRSPICLKDGYLKDDIYVESQYVKGLNEAIDELSAIISELEELV